MSNTVVSSLESLPSDFVAKEYKNVESKSLLKVHLTPEVYESLRTVKTENNGSLYHVINSGVQNPEASIGVYAPDPSAYTVFKDLFDPIINDYHKFSVNDVHPATDLGSDKLDQLPPLDPESKYIISTRIRCGRTLNDIPMNSLMKEEDYKKLEEKVGGALKGLEDDELKGTYYPLDGMSEEDRKQLVADHFLFKNDDKHLEAAMALRFWPIGRGIFLNKEKTFLVWIGEEDHIRIISMQKGGDVGSVLGRLNRGIQGIEKSVEFARSERLGWITFCPTNLGSTVRASVHIRLPKVSARPDFKELCEGMNLQVRGIHGEHSESEGGIYDISNKRRLGLTEFQAVKEMYDGVKKLIDMENDA